MNTSALIAGLQLHRFVIIVGVAAAVLLAAPSLAPLGLGLLLLCGLGSALGLCMVAANAPKGSGLWGRLALALCLGVVGGWLQVSASTGASLGCTSTSLGR